MHAFAYLIPALNHITTRIDSFNYVVLFNVIYYLQSMIRIL